MEHVIDVEGLRKNYGGVDAVKDLTLKVRPGRVFGLIGANGAGKTTTIKSLTGQIRPTSGRVSVLGIDLLKDPVGVRKLVGIIPEQEAPPSFLTGEEYLSFVCAVRGLKDAERRASFWFEYLDFEGQKNMLCKDLSRGTRQKLMVAQAFIHEPNLIFIDEPLVNLDPVIQKKVKDYLTGYARKGNTVFLCTHILEIVEEICDEIAVLDRGVVLSQGPLKEITGRRHLEDVFLELIGGKHV